MHKPQLYTYIRMSTDMQADKGTSEERQREMAIKYAEDNDLEYKYENEYKDLGVSAYTKANLTNGALGRFVSKVLAGIIPKGSILVAENFDRLSRADPLDVSLLLRQLNSSGIKLVLLDTGKEYTADSQKELPGLMDQIFESYRAHKESERK